MTLPLAGRRVLVTRAVHQAGRLAEGLRELGAEPVEVPVLEIQPPEDFAPLDAALRHIAEYDWLIVTSANTMRALVERAAALKLPLEVAAMTKIAAVGEATSAAVRAVGLAVSFVPKTYVAESLVAELREDWAGKRVLLARAATARDVIPDALRGAGAVVDVVDAYRNVLPADAHVRLRSAMDVPPDAATFTSTSSVTHLVEAAVKAGVLPLLREIPAVSIGPVTSETLHGHDWPVAAEADPHDIPGLIAAVRGLLAR